MWLINSPIGRKVVMSVTGICLILFLTFHCCMNVAAFFSGDAYNTICAFLGANWYAIAGSIGLAVLAVCHIVFAFILTAQNLRARGEQRYEYGQVIDRALFLCVGRGKVYRDTADGECEARVFYRRAHPVFRLVHGGVRQSDNVKARQTLRQVGLNLNHIAVHPEQTHTVYS